MYFRYKRKGRKFSYGGLNALLPVKIMSKEARLGNGFPISTVKHGTENDETQE